MRGHDPRIIVSDQLFLWWIVTTTTTRRVTRRARSVGWAWATGRQVLRSGRLTFRSKGAFWYATTVLLCC